MSGFIEVYSKRENLDSLDLDRFDFFEEENEEERILHIFDLCDAAWVHSGDPKDPHAELTSGFCSNGFFDCMRVLKYVNLSKLLAHLLVRKIKAIPPIPRVDWVIASPMAGITFGHDVAEAIGARCFMFTEKNPQNFDKMLWRRVTIPAGETVLQVEELITTAKTLNAVQTAVNSGNPDEVTWIPLIAALVHRSPGPVAFYGNRGVISLINKRVWAVPQEECSLCAAGSQRYRPKTHWAELTGKA
ncbi:hypothetical protein KJ641_01665 [Patescibacteria group bacterium]|nr:hypothetical protein [Patescibacteria group bacterium]